MRYATAHGGGVMSEGLGSATHWLMGPIGAAVGAAGLWLANRAVGRAAVQSALNSGFSQLLTELQEERSALAAQLRQERQEFAAERVEFMGEIRNLKQTIRSLVSFLQRHGLEPPNEGV